MASNEPHQTWQHGLPERLRSGLLRAKLPGLDGLRALAAWAVVFYHLGVAIAPISQAVMLFFVLSGFLITTLLVEEWLGSTTIRLGAFWGRRARRLLPALFLLLVGIAVYSWRFAPAGTQGAIRGDALSTLAYVSNWHLIATGQSYFTRVSAPSPLLHTWSLAIEEQFYVVWPIVVLVALRLWRSTNRLLVLAVVGALASAVWMALLFHHGAGATRLYFGTDTRAQDVLVGAAAALWVRRDTVRRGWSGLGLLGVVGFAGLWWLADGNIDRLFQGGFLVFDLAMALVVISVLRAEHGPVARLLGLAPLVLLGRISYGVYLWHWPLFLVLTGARTHTSGVALFCVRVAVTLAVATASYVLVERPIRQLTFGSWRSWGLVPAGALVVAGVVVVGTSAGAASNVSLDTTSVQSSAHGHDPTVLFVGDSLSLTFAGGFLYHGPHYGLHVVGRPLPGCALVTGGPYVVHGVSQNPLGPCTSWPTLWATEIRQLHPSLVVLTEGWWETMNQLYDGRVQSLLDPDLAAHELAQYKQAGRLLHATGVPVVFTTSPYFSTGEQPDGRPWPEDDPVRVDRLNQIIETAAATERAYVTVIPLNRLLDPHGHFTWTIAGRTVRMSDGVHTTFAAGDLMAPVVLPELRALTTKSQATG